jgi:hypothetical protein
MVYGITLLDFVTSFYLPRRSSGFARIALAAALLALTSPSGCRRVPLETARKANSPSAESLRTNLSLVPADARIVLSLDLERLRGKPVWKKGMAGLARDAGLSLDGFAKGTGVDLTEQARGVLIAVPAERQDDDRFVLIAETGTVDEPRVTAWLRQRQDGKMAAFVHGGNHIVIAKGAWASSVVALAKAGSPAPSAAGDPELRRLCERAAGDHIFWLAAIVPAALRRSLIEQARFPDVASVTRLSGSVDLDGGLHAKVVAELSNEADALSLAHRLGAYVNAAKRHPDMLAQGFSPYLEAVRLAVRGASVHASLTLPAAQQDDLAPLLENLVHAAWTKPPAGQ